MDLPMAQIPNFQLPGPQNVPQPGGPYGQLAAGVGRGMELGLQAKQLAQQKQQQQIEKNMKMLETGSQMMLEGGPEVQATGQQLIQKSYPFLTGQELPQGMPLGKEQAKDLGWAMDQHRLFIKTNGQQGLSAQDAVSLAIQNMSRYGKKYQEQQMGLLEKDPMYKEAMANQVGGEVNGQPATKNEYTGEVSSPSGQAMPGAQGSFVDSGQAASLQQANQAAATSNFSDMTKDHQEVLPNGANALNMIAQPVPANATETQKSEFALHDKQAMIKYAQMLIPSSKRPPNMAMEDMIKSGLAGEEIKSIFNRATNNVAMSDTEREAVSKTIAKTLLNNESQLSTIEQSSASRATRNRVNPLKAIQNVRPPGVPSTSPLFPQQQVPSAKVQTGQILKNPSDGKYYVFRGQTGTQDWKVKSNWIPVQ